MAIAVVDHAAIFHYLPLLPPFRLVLAVTAVALVRLTETVKRDIHRLRMSHHPSYRSRDGKYSVITDIIHRGTWISVLTKTTPHRRKK
jgi:hypothetical protein